MSVLVVGSVALDSVETPFGKANQVIGGSGTFFSASASHLAPVQLVGVVGDD
jgi:sugar/nucleoside kinase (ribokinase family)